MKKMIPVLIAVVLILIIGAVSLGGMLWDKYSYSKERADLDEYYEAGSGGLAILLQDERIGGRAVLRDGTLYFDMDTVWQYFNEGFYVDRNEQKLLYTEADDTTTAQFGQTGFWDRDGTHEGDSVYVAADYVKLFTNYAYTPYDRYVQVYTEWGARETMEVTRNTQVRVKGGIKSPILRDLEKGETVEILEQMDTWSKVKTSDSVIGYVENKRLGNLSTEVETPVTDYVAPSYTTRLMDRKVNLGWHSIGGPGGNGTLDGMVAEGRGMNVIAPTWFSLTDNQGNFRSFADTAYVTRAHGYGLQVWGVWDNFNYKNETGSNVDSLQILSSTTIRQQLVQNIVTTSVNLGLDGVNIDFESLTVLCRESGLILSIDNYVPFQFNNYYRLDIQGQIADYVIIMGYDEHWHGSKDPGSVASIEYVSNGIANTLEKVPAEKVVNALPFYTILWRTEGTEVTDQYITLNNMADYLTRMNIQPEWDETTCQNYAEWQEGAATYQIWIEDAQSIQVKLNVMSAKGIGGVAVWRLGYGTPAVWDLVAAYAAQ